jgi:serine protease Do
MRRATVAGVSAVGLVIAAVILAPVVVGQNERPSSERRTLKHDRHMMIADGRGAEIGVSIRDLDAVEVSKAKLPQPAGALVQEVVEDGPAAKAGIKQGDVILEFDGERVRSARHFSRLVQETPDRRTVKATIVRDGASQTVDVTPEAGDHWTRDLVMPDVEAELERGLRNLPRDFAFDFDFHGPGGEFRMMPRGRFGVTLQPLNEQLASYFGVKDGVLVSWVEPDSPAAHAGIKAGDVVTTINGRAVKTPREAMEELSDVEAGKDVEVGIVRDRKTMTVKTTMPEPASRQREARPA